MKKLIFILTFVFIASMAASAETRQKYIGMKRAKAIASKQVAGKIKGSELEKEHVKMIYSIDIRGRDGMIHEVTLDAFSGDVLSSGVETPADEAKEKADDKKARKH